MAKVKFKVVDESTIELAQDAKKGDTIDLSEVNELDLNVLSSSLRNELDKVAENKAKVIAANSIEKERLLAEKNANEFASKKIELKQDEINKLKEQLAAKNVEILNAEKNFKTEYEKKILKLEAAHKDQLLKLEEHNKSLIIAKRGQTVKDLGEELERYCELKFRDSKSTGGFKNCTLSKDNDAVANEGGKATKADYIFTVKDDDGNVLTKVCCEMKNEQIGTTSTKKKNEDYYERLRENQIKKGCEYALLVSELEKDDDFIFREVYPKMFVCRPNYFINILNIFYSLAIKCEAEIKKIKIKEKQLNEENASKTAVMNYVSEFKDSVLTNLTQFSEKMQKVVDNMIKITKAASDSQEICETWVNKKLQTILNKINKFDLSKKQLKIFKDDEE